MPFGFHRPPSFFSGDIDKMCTFMQMTQSNEMRPMLNQVRDAGSEEDLQTLWQMFITRFPAAKTLITYIEKNWMTTPQKERWVKFAREVRITECSYYQLFISPHAAITE